MAWVYRRTHLLCSASMSDEQRKRKKDEKKQERGGTKPRGAELRCQSVNCLNVCACLAFATNYWAKFSPTSASVSAWRQSFVLVRHEPNPNLKWSSRGTRARVRSPSLLA